jgi:hypothetical protein
MTTWVFFGMDPQDRAVGFRYHNGDLTEKVQEQIVLSLRKEDEKRRDCRPDCEFDAIQRVIAYPLRDTPTTHGSQRWVGGGTELYLWERGHGLSELGWWRPRG